MALPSSGEVWSERQLRICDRIFHWSKVLRAFVDIFKTITADDAAMIVLGTRDEIPNTLILIIERPLEKLSNTIYKITSFYLKKRINERNKRLILVVCLIIGLW